jgi:hypothetical protein
MKMRSLARRIAKLEVTPWLCPETEPWPGRRGKRGRWRSPSKLEVRLINSRRSLPEAYQGERHVEYVECPLRPGWFDEIEVPGPAPSEPLVERDIVCLNVVFVEPPLQASWPKPAAG